MKWIQHHGAETFGWKSADGYYGISPPGPGQVEHQAFHIVALWASPTDIGRATTLAGAQQVCEHHRASATAPA